MRQCNTSQLQYKLPMRPKNLFNFQSEISNHLPKIISTSSQFDNSQSSNQCPCQHIQKLRFNAPKQDEHKFKKEYKLAAYFQTLQCILYAFSSSTKIDSKIIIEILKKKNAKTESKSLKTINAQVTFLQFAHDQTESIHLLVGTKCGNLILYKTFEQNDITIDSIKVSSNEITYILIPSFKNCALVLNKLGSIYLLNFFKGVIYYQFKSSIPLIEDPNQRLIIDLSETFIVQVFSYGRFIIWEITQDMKETLVSSILPVNNSSKIEKESLFQENCQSIDDKLKQGVLMHWQNRAKFNKMLILRSKMSITSTLVNGIIWADFIGTFIALINHNGELLVLAISINEFNQNQQFFTIISQCTICNDVKNGKTDVIESIADAIRLKDNSGMIVGKNIEYFNCGKIEKTRCVIEKYSFDHEFKVNKILTISLNQINFMKQLLVSTQLEYFLIRNDNEYELFRNKRRDLL